MNENDREFPRHKVADVYIKPYMEKYFEVANLNFVVVVANDPNT